VVEGTTVTDLSLLTEGWEEFAPDAHGALDPQLFAVAPGTLELDQTSKPSYALSSVTQLSGHPTLSQNGRAVAMDPNQTVYFCDLTGASDFEDSDSCVSAGFVSRFGTARRETLTDRRARLPNVLRNYDEVLLHKGVFEDVDSSVDFYQVSFEGELPGSLSKHGIHGGLSDDGWQLNDPTQDFCELGIEAGDMVIIERFRLNSGDLATCAPWVSPSLVGPPAQRLEPLRYRVKSSHAHTLELEQDDRETYHQLGRTSGQEPPRPAAALAPPPPECVLPGFTYQVRVADDQWLVTSGSQGYRHWWTNVNGACTADKRRPSPTRAQLTKTYDDGRLQFRIDVPDNEEMCDGQPCNPYLIGAVLSFGFVRGGSEKRGQSTARFPSAMRWLGFDDRLYVLDATLGSVISVEGLDPARTDFYESGRLE